MNYNDIRRLVKLVETSEIAELEIEEGDGKLRIVKTVQGGSGSVSLPQFLSIPQMLPGAIPGGYPPALAQSGGAAQPQPSQPAALPVRKLIEVQSPMVGTFYRAPAPEAPPYVDVGDQVKPGKVLCIVEAMKLMNEIECEVTGKIVEILVENAQPVEFGQVLFRIDPV